MMQIRMRNAALRHFEHINTRTLRSLQDLDLFEDEVGPIVDNLDLAVLSNPEHTRRQNITDGPLLLYVTDEEEPKRVLVELPVLLFSDSQDVREATMECFMRMAKAEPLIMTSKTAGVVQEFRETLVTDSPDKWRPAAIAVYDSLDDDVLLALKGIRQSLECEPVIQESLNSYTPKVMFPSVTSLDTISLSVRNPEKDHTTLADIISEVVARSDDLAELCSEYFVKLGYLPFAPQYSLAKAVNMWLASNPEVEAWQAIWDWARTCHGPLPQYHACSVFVLHPELIPEDKLPILWKEVVAVVYDSDRKGADLPEHECWRLRRELVRHYAYHLESLLPDNDGTSISCFAWFFAEQVASLFPDNPEAAKFYRENWVKPALDLSIQIWLAANPPIHQSSLRYASLTLPSPWSVSLLALMGEHMISLAPSDQPEEVQAQFHDALVSSAIGCLPFPVCNPSDPTFATECSMAETVLKWAKNQVEEQRKGLEQLVATSRVLGSIDGVCNALRNLRESPLADQILVGLALKAKVYAEPKIAEHIWTIISDEKWRRDVLVSVETQVQDLLIESLTVLLVNNREKWCALLPHYIAELCETAQEEERRRVLFLYVIHTSLASDTVSALRRLLRGNQKAKFVEYIQEYRNRIDAMRTNYPPWVAGKLRGLMASLHVV